MNEEQSRVLLTVSGVIDREIEVKIARGERPMADYLAMQQAFQADLIDYARARQETGRFGRILEKLAGPDLTLAWACFLLRRRYPVIFTDGEQVGIPLGLMLKLGGRRRPRHRMIAHILSVGKKMLFFDWLKVQNQIDTFVVYSTWQKSFIEERWKIQPERVVFTPFMVDARFFSPNQNSRVENLADLIDPEKPLICTAGLEYRDYPTLLAAVRGLNVQVVIAAASPWSKRPDSTSGQEIPENVIVRRFSQYDLRWLYAQSRFVVMPLYKVNFQAGVTAILEAMAMGKAVICSRTPGQADILEEGRSGLYVPPQDPEALKKAILYLLDNPQAASQMGEYGRREVEGRFSLDCYVERLKTYMNPTV